MITTQFVCQFSLPEYKINDQFAMISIEMFP